MPNISNASAPRLKKNSELIRIFKMLGRNKIAVFCLCFFLFEILIAIIGPYVAPYDYTAMDMTSMFQKPSMKHFFGTDDLGRDIFSRILIGARYSITMGLCAVALSTTLGLIIGSVAGFFGGQTDNVIMRLLDVIQALPGMLLMIVLSAVLGSGFFNTILALSVNGIPATARMLRAQMLRVREAEFIEAAHSINCSRTRIIVQHLLPNSISPIIVQTTMGIAGTITMAASLSFIGLGIQPPIPEWGAMLSASRQYIRQYPYMIIFPGLAIAITVLCLNILGDGLRDVLDPKLKN